MMSRIYSSGIQDGSPRHRQGQLWQGPVPCWSSSLHLLLPLFPHSGFPQAQHRGAASCVTTGFVVSAFTRAGSVGLDNFLSLL